jgi:HEAT repeat protein
LIRASSASTLDSLIKALGSESSIDRETAIARLTLSGGRALPRLIELVTADKSVRARIGALKVLEGVAAEGALGPILSAAAAPDAEVAAAAIAAVVPLLSGPRGSVAVDQLTATALDPNRDQRVRVAAIRALKTLKPSTIAPLLKTLAKDRHDAVRLAAVSSHADAVVVLTAAARGQLPERAADLEAALDEASSQVSLADLLHIIEHVRPRQELIRARGRAHAALAARGSRIALYDLRESIEPGTPLSIEFVAALTRIGDSSALEAIATAYAATKDAWWRRQLAAAFRTISKREKITRRSAVVKRIEKRRPDVVQALLP